MPTRANEPYGKLELAGLRSSASPSRQSGGTRYSTLAPRAKRVLGELLAHELPGAVLGQPQPLPERDAGLNARSTPFSPRRSRRAGARPRARGPRSPGRSRSRRPGPRTRGGRGCGRSRASGTRDRLRRSRRRRRAGRTRRSRATRRSGCRPAFPRCATPRRRSARPRRCARRRPPSSSRYATRRTTPSARARR